MNSFLLYKQNINCGNFQNFPDSKLLISTINAHSYNVAQKNETFANALKNSDVLLADGIGIVLAFKFLNGINLKKQTGNDLFEFEMKTLNGKYGKCFFLGSTTSTLEKIENKVFIDYPNVKVKSYSPPFAENFLDEEIFKIINLINSHKPDVLFIGMTAPKQEIWSAKYFSQLSVKHICCIGAVFDFYSGNIKRAPKWIINIGMEWLYRFANEPSRLWKRYLIGNVKFIFLIFIEKFNYYLK